ncbi:MAG: GIN domain-containing protein [Mucilaginibacter sp.]
MKKTILTIAILLATVFGISQSSFAATSHEEVTTLNEVGNINKIEIHGNVELYVSDGTTDEVKVYNHYYAESALVQDQNGVLRISSYSTQKLVVWVKVSDLRDIAIYDDAEVKSFGKLSAIDLDVKLYNNASARLNMDAYSANVTLNGHAKADLTGELVEGSVSYDKSSYLNTTNLVASHLVEKVNAITCKPSSELASL